MYVSKEFPKVEIELCMQLVKAPAGKELDKATGLSSADMSVVQDQLRASFEAIHDLKDRLDSTDKQLAGYVKLLMASFHGTP